MFTKILGVTAACMAVAACSGKGAGVPAINSENFDLSTAPGEDFYQYATGGWQKNNPLKPEFSRYGSFDILAENNQVRLNDLFRSLAGRKLRKGTVEQKIADLYLMGLDSVKLNAEGGKPVGDDLRTIEAVSSVEEFVSLSAEMQRRGGDGLFGVYVGPDLMDNTNQILYIDESGLSMPNRDYYLLPEHAELRTAFREYLEKLFALAGYEDAAARAQDAFDVEMMIAVPFWSMVQQRDVEAQYNPMSSKELFAEYPHTHFDSYFALLGVPEQEKLVVGEPSYFKALDGMLADIDPVKLRHFLQSKVLNGASGFMSDDFYAASFEFFSGRMAGIKEQKPRWKRAMALPNGVVGEAVGQMYVDRYFSKKDKERMLGIVRNIQAALSEHIASLEWMSAPTKEKAQEKLSAFTVKIGYPDKWKDYSSLEIDRTKSYYENVCNASRWHFEDNLAKLGQPVDREEWHMTPQTVNAYYNPTTNEICFPAGILQPPFYFPEADDAVNYGAIGVVISHEMTHGFDDQGRLFDKDGNMKNWWTDEDSKAFKDKTEKLVAQFDEVEVLPGVKANGAATLGENIADQGGLRIAYTAMQNSFGDRHPDMIDGLTAEQRFYIAYATVWAQNITDEEIVRRTLVDVHSIGENRVNVSLRNLRTFFDAFAIREGDRMWRPEEERVIIW
ncbi:MAG: M13 family metallopeptidase [Bacteroidales bacterium]|nr:M13 family metallopeptidase [Bacteroidales bacterium]